MQNVCCALPTRRPSPPATSDSAFSARGSSGSSRQRRSLLLGLGPTDGCPPSRVRRSPPLWPSDTGHGCFRSLDAPDLTQNQNYKHGRRGPTSADRGSRAKRPRTPSAFLDSPTLSCGERVRMQLLLQQPQPEFVPANRQLPKSGKGRQRSSRSPRCRRGGVGDLRLSVPMPKYRAGFEHYASPSQLIM